MSDIKPQDMPGVRSADSKLVGELWDKAVILQSNTENVLGQFEGPEGSGKAVCVKTNLKAGAGDTVHFTVHKSLGGSATRGDAKLEGNEELPQAATYKCRVDQVRHAVGYTNLIEHLMAAGHSLESAYAKLCGEHFGLTKQEDGLMCLIQGANFHNTVRAGGRSSTDALTKDDVMTTDLIADTGAVLSSRGGKPANVSKSNSGATIEGFTLFGSDIFLRPLKSDDSYLTAVSHAGERGDKNVLFRGGYVQWDGHFIYPWHVKDADTYGPIGAPVQAKGLLGNPVVAENTLPVITGSGETIANLAAKNLASNGVSYYEPFKFFKGYPYKFLSHDTPSSDSNTYYFIIWNISGPDAGKYGVYSYTGSANTGHAITTSKRLRAAASGDAVTTLAGQTWDGNIHTDAHPTGSIIIQVNSGCVPFGYGFMLGANSLVCAYGNTPMTRIKERGDYGERKGMGYKSIYGQAVAKDTTGNPRNYMLIEAAISYPGINITYSS